MLIKFLHGLAVLLALLGIVLLDRAFAQSAPNAGTEEIATFASRFSALTDAPQPAPPLPQPATTSEPQEHSTQMPMPAQPFALNATPVTDGEVLDKWNALVADVRSESEILARCRTDAAHCPAAAKKFLDVIADGRAHDGRARVGVINRDINMAIRPTSDLAQWGVTDRWSARSPRSPAAAATAKTTLLPNMWRCAKPCFLKATSGLSSCAIWRIGSITRSPPPASTRRG
jgi:hypothetical protein